MSSRVIPCAVLISGLTIERFCMTGGKSPVGYLTAYLTNLYLSADSEKVQEAIEAGWNCLCLLLKAILGTVCLSQKVVLLHQTMEVIVMHAKILPFRVTKQYFSAFFPSDPSIC